MLLGVLCWSGGDLYAWGDEGHRIVGEIAWLNLTPQTAQRVRELLDDDDETYRTLAGAARWADHVKSDADRTWHFVNLPRDAGRAQIEEACARPRWCVIAAVRHFRRVLADEGEAAKRRDALKYLAHLVGDLHQPLHATSRDAGGNTRQVAFFGSEKRTLHAIWDSAILRKEIRRRSTGWRCYAHRLASAVTPEERRTWTETEPERWALESLELVYTRVYPAPENVEDRYYEVSRPVIEEQLRRAGVRLAALLNDALR